MPIALLLPILQLAISSIPELVALWPTIAKSLQTGTDPAPAEMAALWAAISAMSDRVQKGI